MGSYEKIGLSSTMGFNDARINTNLGAYIDKVQQNNIQSYSIPLIGCLSTAKFIPAFISDIEIDLTLNNPGNFICTLPTATMIAPIITIKNVELVCEAITLEAGGMQQLMAMFPGQMKLKSQSYLYGSSSIAASTPQGTVDITYSHSLNSLKQFIWWSSPATVWELNYGGVNPNLSSWQLLIGSTAYPQQLVKADKVAECFMQNQKAFGALYSSSNSGSAARFVFSKASTLSTSVTSSGSEYYAYSTKPADYASIATAVANKWYQALDLEIINNLKETLYTGISTKGSTNTLRLNIQRALKDQTHAIHFYSCFDVILEFDYLNQTINVIQ